MADTPQSFNQTWTAPTKVGGRYIQAPLVQPETGFFRNITQNAPTLENNYNLSRTSITPDVQNLMDTYPNADVTTYQRPFDFGSDDYYYNIWSNPQPLGLLVEPGVNPQHSRNYAFENQDFPEVILDIQNAPATWGGSSVGTKIRNDLGNDPAIRSTLEQFPSKVLRGDQSWKNMVTTDEVDRLSSRLFGSGYFGNRLKEYARFDNRFLDSDPEDRAHFKEGSEGYFKKQDGTLMNPFDIMYYDEIKETDPISAIDSGVFDDQFTVGDDAEASLFPLGYTTGVDPFQTNADTLQSFFNIPEVTPIGTGGGMGGMIEDGVQTDFEPVEVMPWGAGEQYMDAQGFDTVMPVLNPFEPLTEEQTVFDRTTPGPIGDYLREQELDYMIDEVFTQEDKAAEDERIRLDKIMTQAREDRIAQEKIAADARRAKEADERRARELREEAARAEDRQNKARLSREAEERDRQAQERAQEERNAAEAARLNSLAEAADKMAIDQARKEQEEQARKQAEFNKQHEAFVKQMDRDWRARQQASMPKSWAFF